MKASILSTLQQVLISPTGFFRLMPRSGALLQAVLFVLVMGLVGAVLLALLQLFTAGFAAALSELVKSVVVLPIYLLFVWAVLSLVFFLVWKIFGSSQNLEVASYCTAYSLSLFPLWLLVRDVHLATQLLILLWAVLLLVIASEVVHGVSRAKAVIAFGVLAVLAAYRACSDCDTEQREQIQPVAPELQPEQLEVASETQATSAKPELPAAELPVVNGSLGNELTDNRATVAEKTTLAVEDEGAEVVLETETETETEGDAAEQLFSLSPEQAGHKLGELVREVTEAVTDVGEDFKRGFESVSTGAAAEATDIPEHRAGAAEAATDKKTVISESDSETATSSGAAAGDQQFDAQTDTATTRAETGEATTAQPEQALEELVDKLSPQELGQLLGQFIRELDQAAQQAQSGFDAAMGEQGEAVETETETESGSTESVAPAQAGRALGEFVRAFNEAVRGLDQTVEPATDAAQQ